MGIEPNRGRLKPHTGVEVQEAHQAPFHSRSRKDIILTLCPQSDIGSNTMAGNTRNSLRSLPSVESVLKQPDMTALIDKFGRTAVVNAVRQTIDNLRTSMRSKTPPSPAEYTCQAVAKKAADTMASGQQPRLKPVINATGIILHTGLGRAVMPQSAADAVAQMTSCCNVQMDLDTGERIKREDCIRDLVIALTGAEEVLLVNNNVGATLLILKALTRGKEVIVSRGELIEIGGSFRLPDVMAESNAILREVGTTNKTHLSDYENAIVPETGLILKVHKSNYEIVGFTEEVGIADLAKIGKRHGVVVADDVGCGALVDLESFGMKHECTVRESLEAGSDIVFFSTDKLIGGPQGGMIVGRKDLCDIMRKHPLYRALRVCKMTLAALEATLRLFQTPELLARKHPLYVMMSKSDNEMNKQAKKLAKLIEKKQPEWNVSIVEGISFLGGGTLPGSSLQSVALSITSSNESAGDISSIFRRAEIPVITRVKEDAVLVDMRTVFPDEIKSIAAACHGVQANR